VKRPRLAVASGNQLGAEAAAEVARAGGNAVDACLASAVMAWVAEPFFASLGGSGFIAVRTESGHVTVYDGNNAMPYNPPTERGTGITRVYLDYSNGMYTGVGGGSVATPGILAALHKVWEDLGGIEWPALFEPAISVARKGIRFPTTSAYYLSETWAQIWSRYDEGKALFAPEGDLLAEGELLVQADLAEALEIVAAKGPSAFYDGELGREVSDAVGADGGLMTLEDLRLYSPEIRTPVTTEAFGWRIESNPPPAVGGAVLTHMLALIDERSLRDPVGRLQTIIAAEQGAVGYRELNYADPGEVAMALEGALARVRRRGAGAPSTTHSSASDASGLVCSLTQSNGYGAGLILHGILLNNTLGEEELNPMGVHGLPPGSRCHSNMAPTIAAGPRLTAGLGSPGADRITGAIAQTIMALAVDGLPLAEAVAAPRVHVARRPEGRLLCYEPGLPGQRIEGYVQRPYDSIHMFFGGVQAASVSDEGVVDAAHDPRRSGASALVA
jgi:gamma-glutamyltranspeptidase/glutathione hydrolase